MRLSAAIVVHPPDNPALTVGGVVVCQHISGVVGRGEKADRQ